MHIVLLRNFLDYILIACHRYAAQRSDQVLFTPFLAEAGCVLTVFIVNGITAVISQDEVETGPHLVAEPELRFPRLRSRY